MSTGRSQRLPIVGRKAAILILGNGLVTYPGDPAWGLVKCLCLDIGGQGKCVSFCNAIPNYWIDMSLARMAVDRLAKQ